MKFVYRMFVVAAVLFAWPVFVLAADLVATDARVYLPKDDSVMMPGTVTLKNNSDQEIIVIKIRSSEHSLAMIHQSLNDSNINRMMLKSELMLKPKSEVRMSRDGVHFMFAGAKSKLKKGSTVNVSLYLNNGERMSVKFDVVN